MLGAIKVRNTVPSTTQIRQQRTASKESKEWISKARTVRHLVIFNAELKKLVKKILLKKDAVPKMLQIATTMFDATNKANLMTVNKISEIVSKIKGKIVVSKTAEFFDLVLKIALKQGITLSKYDIEKIYEEWRKVTNNNFKLLLVLATIPSGKISLEDQKKISALNQLLTTDRKKKKPKTKKPQSKPTVTQTSKPKIQYFSPRYEGVAERELNKRLA
jgi:hypothetical protein